MSPNARHKWVHSVILHVDFNLIIISLKVIAVALSGGKKSITVYDTVHDFSTLEQMEKLRGADSTLLTQNVA